MPTSTVGRSTDRGFTLIELSVVMLLIVLFGAFTLPFLHRLGQDDGSATARRLAAMVKLLFNEAAISGKEHQLVFDHEQGRFSVLRLEENDVPLELERFSARLALPEGIGIKDIAFRERGALTSGVATIHFSPAGFLDECLIHIMTADRFLTLIPHPLTGVTAVEEGYRAW